MGGSRPQISEHLAAILATDTVAETVYWLADHCVTDYRLYMHAHVNNNWAVVLSHDLKNVLLV